MKRPNPIVRQIVDRCHVGESNLAVIRYVISRAKPKALQASHVPSMNNPEPGEIVMVKGGRYDGCILTYIRPDTLSGQPICEHSEYCGGLRVPEVIRKQHCSGCGRTEFLFPAFCMDLCLDCLKVVRAHQEQEEEFARYANMENPPL